jgi:hypothetical protein
VKGKRRVYDRPPYSTPGNLVVNSNFSSGLSGWKLSNLTDSGGNTLCAIVNHDGKSWARINQEAQTGNGKHGLLEQTISIPTAFRNEVIEISFLVSGLFTGFRVSGDSPDIVINAKIGANHPERIYYYYHPRGASSVTVSFLKGYPGQKAVNEYCDISEIAVRKSSWKSMNIDTALPATGSTIQFARWLLKWDESAQLNQLYAIKRLGGMARVWLSSELFATYVTKNNPVKRSSTNLTDTYRNASTAKVFTGIDQNKSNYVDWLFDNCQKLGIRMSVGIVGSFTDGKGNPHPTHSVPLSFEFLDTDPDIQNGFKTLVTSVVSRYKKYDNIAAWDFYPESWSLWRHGSAGFAPSAPYSTERSLTFPHYRELERSLYKTIKSIDPKRPVLMHTGGEDLYLLNTDDVCDWSGVSDYLGLIRIVTATGNPSRFRVSNGSTYSLANGTPLKAYTTGSLPAGINGTDTYYVVNVSPVDFEIAATPNGTGLKVSGGNGDLFYYSPDGTSVAAFENIFQRWSDYPKPTLIVEMGAPNAMNNSYRIDIIEVGYLREGLKRLKKYGFIGGIVFDEFPGIPILFDQNFTMNQSGKLVESVGSKLFDPL